LAEKITFPWTPTPVGVPVDAAEEGEYRRGEKRVVLVENGRKKVIWAQWDSNPCAFLHQDIRR
jgi:hypothetical protein